MRILEAITTKLRQWTPHRGRFEEEQLDTVELSGTSREETREAFDSLYEAGFRTREHDLSKGIAPPQSEAILLPKTGDDFQALDYLFGGGDLDGLERPEALKNLKALYDEGYRFASFDEGQGIYPDHRLGDEYQPYFIYQLHRAQPEAEIWFMKKGCPSFPLTPDLLGDKKEAARRNQLVNEFYDRDLKAMSQAKPSVLVYQFWRDYARELLQNEEQIPPDLCSRYLSVAIEANQYSHRGNGDERDFKAAQEQLHRAMGDPHFDRAPADMEDVARLTRDLMPRIKPEDRATALQLLTRSVAGESAEERSLVLTHAVLREPADLAAAYQASADRVFRQGDSQRLEVIRAEVEEHKIMAGLFDHQSFGLDVDVEDQGDYILVGDVPLNKQL